jgi:hypothetical protein
VTGQDAGQDGIRLEISPPGRYTRAGAYENGGDPGEPITLELPGRAGKTTVLGGPPETQPRPEPEPTEAPAPRPAHYPLRRRGANIRDVGHAAYYDATTPWEGVVAAYDYARSAATRAEKGGMPIPPDTDALFDAGRALMTVGDALTAAMHTWSPEA